MSERETVIGLEVHAQLATRGKMFCGCPTVFGAPPNSRTCPICQGMPGVLPVINRRAVEFAVRAALALGLRVNPTCRFARKHYYYPDMPKNFQISQYEEPLAEDGALEVEVSGATRRIGIQRLHLEEDVGKLVHEGAFATAQASLVDYNRSGVPLMETVSRPDLRSPEEAAAYLRAFRAVLVYLGVCDGNMEEGSLRCDANVSLRPRGAGELGTKVEIKNLNSFRNVQRALDYEVRRQAEELKAGRRIAQETRLFDADRGVTRSTRSKEYAHDYRYFPEPDLVPLAPTEQMLERAREALPELPAARLERFEAEYDLTPETAAVLVGWGELGRFFEDALASGSDGGVPNARTLAGWVTGELVARLREEGLEDPSHSKLSPKALADLVVMIERKALSQSAAKDVLAELTRSGGEPAAIVEAKGLAPIADSGELEALIERAIADNEEAVEKVRAGKTQAAGAIVGAVMRETKGRADGAEVTRLVREKLGIS
jgi:aspartyl-tRNA(Asn)/glutamyl-tRNA(Gln) amidotransferase subunit B